MSHSSVLRTLPTPLPALAVGGAAALAVGVVAVLDPNQAGSYPTCPFLAVTGLQCPGCGTLRAVHALLHGDLVTAVDLNVLAVLAIPLFAWAWVAWLRSSWRGRRGAPVLPAAASYGIAALFTAFWVLRNLPGFDLLAA